MTTLKEIRIAKQLTQQEAARRLGVSLRSYIMYENDNSREDTLKYRFLLQELQKINAVDEEHGVLTIEQITKICKEIFDAYQVQYCYLFGSYAKGKATERSETPRRRAASCCVSCFSVLISFSFVMIAPSFCL